MPSRRFCFVPFLILVFPLVSLAQNPVDTQLRIALDDLLRRAVRRPYGLAWNADAASQLARDFSPEKIEMGKAATPAAALVLLWGGQYLHEPRFTQAAMDAVRAIGVAETAVGQVRSEPIFAAAPGGHDDPLPVPDRTATDAALGFLLAELEANPPAPASTDGPAAELSSSSADRAQRSAERAARWLASQLTPNGLWPTAFPPGPQTQQTIRIVRLDSPDYRDSSLALLLASSLLHDDVLARLSDRPVSSLLRLRLISDPHGPNLWCTVCTIGANDIPQGFPRGPDLLATQHVMETLTAANAFKPQTDVTQAISQAIVTIRQIPLADGRCNRFLNPATNAALRRELSADAPTTSEFFHHPATAPAHPDLHLSDQRLEGDYQISQWLGVRSAPTAQELHKSIEATLCGLSHGPPDAQAGGPETPLSARVQFCFELLKKAQSTGQQQLTR
jgi:hypothetical protein